MSAEQQLWRAVINQALVDAFKTHVSTWQEEERFAPQIARDWFKGNSAHFRFVCEAAGYDPDYVRNKALKRIALLCATNSGSASNSYRRPGKKITQSQPVTSVVF